MPVVRSSCPAAPLHMKPRLSSALFFSPDFKEINSLNFRLPLLQGPRDCADDKRLRGFTERGYDAENSPRPTIAVCSHLAL